MDQQQSPVFKKRVEEAQVAMKFPQAIEKVIEGKRITKVEWRTDAIFGILKDGILMLHKEDGKFYQWILSEGDLKGEDWILLSDAN